MKCEKCGLAIGVGAADNSVRVSHKLFHYNFTTFEEALKGYINVESEFLDGLIIRKLDEVYFRFGEIIVNILF